ncbi:transposase [Lachnospiraceae bacterium ZAX-1]
MESTGKYWVPVFNILETTRNVCLMHPKYAKVVLGGELSYVQLEKFKIIRKHMDNLENLKGTLETFIYQLAEQYQSEITLLLTVLGIDLPLTAIRILAEIGADMSVFETAKELCSWTGVSPQKNESAGKKKTSRISRAGAYLKPLLV